MIWGSPVLYRDHQMGPGGPPGGATHPGGPRGLKWGGNQPIVGWCAPPGLPPAPRVGNPRAGGAPLALGGKDPPLAAAPLWRCISRAGTPLGGLYKGGGEGGQRDPTALVPPSPLLHLSLSP